MKARERTLLIVVLCLIAGTAGTLRYMKSHQRMGQPGVRTSVIPGSPRLQIELATNAPGYSFQELPVDKTVTEVLPADTSIRRRT